MKILLVVYDNDSYISQFPIGIAQLAAVLEKNNEINIWQQDINHYADQDLTKLLDREKYDFVGLSFVGGYYQYRKAISLSNAINNSKNRPFYAIGGHGPSPEPEFFLRKTGADVVCIGEGDKTIQEIIEVASGLKSKEKVRGIAYVENDKCIINEKRPLIDNINLLPFPSYHLFPVDVYRLLRMPRCASTDFVMPILSGRGCPFKCNFCYRMDKGFRPRSNESIIEEIKLLNKNYGINYIAFFDELLMNSVERVTLLCEDFLKHGINIKWDCNGRLNYAEESLLRLMARSGCVFINYGIEAFDDVVLRNMHKSLTTKQIISGVEATLRAGISPGLNIIFGNHGDNKHTLQKGVEFLLKYDDGAQMRTIRPVTPYPGCELYYDAIRAGKIKDCEDFYENKHINSDLMTVNFTDMQDEEYYEALHKANMILLKNYYVKSKRNMVRQLDELYVGKNSSFRGFRQT